MAVLEREGVRGVTDAPWRRETGGPWDDRVVLADGGPPDLPPAFYWDDDDDDDDSDANPWARRILATIGIVVLLCMVVSPVAADLLGGHSNSGGGVTASTGDR